MNFFKQSKKFLLEMLFPRYCLNCQKQGQPICPDCLSLISLNEFLYCPFCSQPNRILKSQLIKGSGVCPKHRSHQLNGLFSAVSYSQPLVKKIINQFKYPPYLKTLSSALAFLIIAYFKTSGNEPVLSAGENSLLIPAPLTKNKKKKRGYNQAALLAEELSRFYQLPLSTDNLIKIKKTASQTNLSREERFENIKGAFQLKNPDAVRDKTIFLIDDVFTTGATMAECAKTLKTAGAKAVWGIALARQALS